MRAFAAAATLCACAALSGCRDDDVEPVTERFDDFPHPCALLPADVLEDIIGTEVEGSSPAQAPEPSRGVQCSHPFPERRGVAFLRIENEVDWRVRWNEERAMFEDRGIELPELQQISGLGDSAILDPRHDSLHVLAGGFVLSADHGTRLAPAGAERALTEDERARGIELKTEMIRAAIERLP